MHSRFSQSCQLPVQLTLIGHRFRLWRFRYKLVRNHRRRKHKAQAQGVHRLEARLPPWRPKSTPKALEKSKTYIVHPRRSAGGLGCSRGLVTLAAGLGCFRPSEEVPLSMHPERQLPPAAHNPESMPGSELSNERPGMGRHGTGVALSGR